MARTEARIFTDIWRDEDFTALEYGAQWLYITLLAQKDLSLCGVLPDAPGRWARLGDKVTAKDVSRWSVQLSDSRFIVCDKDTLEVWIRGFIRHGDPLRTPNLLVGLARDFTKVYSPPIRDGIVEELYRLFPEGIELGLRDKFPYGLSDDKWDHLPEGFRQAIAYSIDHPMAHSSSLLVHKVTTVTKAPTATKGKAPPRQRKRDLIFEALAEEEGIDWHNATNSELGALRSVAAELRKVGATPEAIHVAAAGYRSAWTTTAYTSRAIAKHWSKFAPKPPQVPTGELLVRCQEWLDYFSDPVGVPQPLSPRPDREGGILAPDGKLYKSIGGKIIWL